MPEPLVLYSTNTWLAYIISQIYYGQQHYVWATPYFSSASVPSHDYTVPPSSSPSEIHGGLLKAVVSGDHHCAKIESNRIGILRGATVKAKANLITAKQRRDIFAIVERAETRDFRPLIYVIPFQSIGALIKEVSVKEKAHPLSEEYVIRNLPRSCFDVIEFSGKD